MSDNKIKNKRKYFGILRRLAKSDTSVLNKLKVTVFEGEFIEEKEHIFIAPSIFISCPNQNSNQISIEDKNENFNEKTKISSKNEIETLDYPNSSDFSDDE